MLELDIILRNFFLMMRSGALNEYVTLEPMSRYKWARLNEIVAIQDVASVASRAIKNQQYEHTFNMPADLREKIHSLAAETKGQTISLKLNNPMLDRKLKKIQVLERKDENCSETSLEVFNIIVANCNDILNHGINTRLVIRLGNYLRIKKQNIDFEKIDRWLGNIQMKKVAQLVGSILITNFAFKPEEVPFVKRVDTKAALTMLECISNGKKQKMSKGLTYFEYAPLENVTILLNRMRDRLEVIEE